MWEMDCCIWYVQTVRTFEHIVGTIQVDLPALALAAAAAAAAAFVAAAAAVTLIATAVVALFQYKRKSWK